jgi:hypothetical protein
MTSITQAIWQYIQDHSPRPYEVIHQEWICAALNLSVCDVHDGLKWLVAHGYIQMESSQMEPTGVAYRVWIPLPEAHRAY